MLTASVVAGAAASGATASVPATGEPPVGGTPAWAALALTFMGVGLAIGRRKLQG